MTDEHSLEAKFHAPDRRTKWAAKIMLMHEGCGNEVRAIRSTEEPDKVIGVWCPEHGRIMY